MNDDLNTREAIAALLELAAAVNRHVDDHEEYDYRRLNRAVDTFESFGAEVLGLAFDGDTDGRVRLAEDVVELVLDVRERERAAGNYDRGDEIRDQLEALGVEVQDTDDGPEFHVE
jgi:cysteinyl-tRNA synthetase